MSRICINSISFVARIKTTFEDICAPATTIDTLQTSISLPLLRPDIFSYGILGRNFTSGMLLFGPPGTGKVRIDIVVEERIVMLLTWSSIQLVRHY
jgi:ATP-dependent 26S proteasome regulatory subunit